MSYHELIHTPESAPKIVSRVIDESIIFGFSKWFKKPLKKKFDALGLPTNNITSLGPVPFELTMGMRLTGGFFNHKTGEMAVLPESRILFHVIAHETAHANDPYTEENDFVYGGIKNREMVAKHVTDVANQTLKTKKYISGYHKYLTKLYRKGRIPFELFLHETHAILIEQRFVNPNHLRQVDAAQRKKIEKIGEKETFVPLLSQENDESVEGVDKTLMILLPDDIKTLQDLDQHILGYQEEFRGIRPMK